jgi:hypothetical protein
MASQQMPTGDLSQRFPACGLGQRRSLVTQFGTLVSQEVPTLPLYVAEPVAVAKGLQAARPRPMGSNQYNTTWNAYAWEWRL